MLQMSTKKALSLLTNMLDEYIHKCAFYPSETIQKLSDLLSLLSFMFYFFYLFTCWNSGVGVANSGDRALTTTTNAFTVESDILLVDSSM